MWRKSKRLAMLLALATAVQTLQPVPVVYAHEVFWNKAIPLETGSISTRIQFDYPISYEKVRNQNIQLTLSKDHEVVLELTLGEENQIIQNNNQYVVQITPLNTQGVEMTTEEILGSYLIDIQGIEQGEYTIQYEGDSYATYETKPIIIQDYSKSVTVHTGRETFSYGDLNGDYQVNQKDLDALEFAIKQGDHTKDLSGDGKVDITELTYIKNQISSTGSEVQQDTSAILSTTIVEEVDRGIQEAGLTVSTGSIENLLMGGSNIPVTINKQDSADGQPLTIPIDLGEGEVETQVIEIVSPNVTGGLEAGSIVVEYIEDGQVKTYSEPFGDVPSTYRGVDFIMRNEGRNTIVIDLGQRVPVKKVSIKVDKVVNEQGNPEYVVLEEVNFIKDILPDGSQIDQTVVKGIQVTPGDKEVYLEWLPVSNVQGYRVYYGEEPGNYTKELNVTDTYTTIEGLENLTPYYFMVRATSDDWIGGRSQELEATPQPSKAPKSPDFLSVEPMNAALGLSWKEAEDATYYKAFYKKTTEEHYEQFMPIDSIDGKIKGTSIAIGGLENGIEYSLYVVAGNEIGESNPSLVVQGIPEKIEVEGPTLPSTNRIPSSEIENIVMAQPFNVDLRYYPNGFNAVYDLASTQDGVKNIVDEDYATHWTARRWWESSEFTITFKTPKEMNYLAYVGRIDDRFRDSLNHYAIKVWEEGDDLSAEGKTIVPRNKIKRLQDEESREYAILEFPKHTVKQISVAVGQWNGSPTNVSASELAFYEYDSLDNDIQALFANDSFTELSPYVTQEQIDRLRSRLNSQGSYYVSHEVFEDELDLAESLLNNQVNSLGIIKDEFISINTTGDPKVVNTWSPLGIVAGPTTEFTIYAEIPEGETLEIIPTQYFAEAGKFTGPSIVLEPGRNTVQLTNIHDISGPRGGALYYRYSGDKADQIKLHIRDITLNQNNSVKEIPTLELYQWYELTEEVRREKIGNYIDQLTQYVTPALKGQQTNPYNATEISMRNMLLSMPADQILAGIQANAATREEQIDKLYHNILAWEELVEIIHTTYGLEQPTQVLNSRQNIRYMRMFGNAFMYAAGSHIGIGYGSVSALAQGKPTEVTHIDGGIHSNSLFGWGIAHEIGHNMDRLGKAEITNNIYSLMVQTYDGYDNTLPSRLEIANKYEDIYKKVAIGDQGLSNDVFVQLGMYWQLHLAYDEGNSNGENGPMSFYNKLFKLYDSGAVNTFSGDEKFAVAASQVAQKDLTEFFTKWGMVLSQEAITQMSVYPQEERKIQYITDESRRQRITGNTGVETIQLSAQTEIVDQSSEVNNKTVRVTIHPDPMVHTDNLLGYEIFRDGKQIAFITGTTYEDYIGSANNMVFDYEIRAIDILGNIVGQKVDAGSIRIEHDNVIDPRYYDIRFETTTGPAITTDAAITTRSDITTDSAIIIEFNKKMPVTGLKVTTSPGLTLSSEFKVEVGTRDSNGNYTYRVAKEGSFNRNEVEGHSKFINYFNKPGVGPEDTRIWTYDADTIRITGADITEEFLQNFEVMPLSYPGDNVEFEEFKVGIMGHDYGDNGDGTPLLPKDTLVVVGNYRGDPIYNTIHIKGKYMESISEDSVIYVERAMNGDLYMFAEVPIDGQTSDISDGFFVFVPDIQSEIDLQGDCSAVSALPVEIMSEMYRYDDVTNTGARRKTSETLWYTTPSYESMPEIILQNTQAFFRQEGRHENN